MTYGFKITDDKHTRTDADIGFTLIGTDSFLGTGTFKFTFPLETEPDYVTSYLGNITDAPTTDTIEPVFHLGIIPIFSSSPIILYVLPDPISYDIKNILCHIFLNHILFTCLSICKDCRIIPF